MRIGIMTYHRAYNCGAMLQAWALYKTITKIGHEASFPICNHVGEAARWISFVGSGKKGIRLIKSFLGWLVVNLLSIGAEGLSQHRYKLFRRKHLPEIGSEPGMLSDHYDLLIFGSDQIWRPALMTEEEQRVFFAESVPEEMPKIAYAASYDDRPLEAASAKRLARTVLRFKKVAARERLLADQIEEETGIKIPIVLDPTLLLRHDEYHEVMSPDYPTGDYLFVYTLYTTPYVMDMANYMAKQLNVKLIIAPVYKFTRYGAPRGLTYGMSPDRLVSYVAHAKYVMSFSFHGTVFSVIFGKQFLDLRNDVDEFETRSGCLLRHLGLSDRAVNPSVTFEDAVARIKKPIGTEYISRLDELREESLKWLNDAISSIESTP